jgi:ribosomal protein L37AE/L43A
MAVKNNGIEIDGLQIYLERIIQDNEVKYVCEKCKRTHRAGTKIWAEHMGRINFEATHFGIVRIAQANKAREDNEKRMDEAEAKYTADTIEHFEAGLAEAKVMVRYHAWSLYATNKESRLQKTGRTNGYESLELLKEDCDYNIEKASNNYKSNRNAFIITRSEVIEVINEMQYRCTECDMTIPKELHDDNGMCNKCDDDHEQFMQNPKK